MLYSCYASIMFLKLYSDSDILVYHLSEAKLIFCVMLCIIPITFPHTHTSFFFNTSWTKSGCEDLPDSTPISVSGLRHILDKCNFIKQITSTRLRYVEWFLYKANPCDSFTLEYQAVPPSFALLSLSSVFPWNTMPFPEAVFLPDCINCFTSISNGSFAWKRKD